MLKSTRVLGLGLWVLDNFKNCVLVLEACVLDSSTVSTTYTLQVFERGHSSRGAFHFFSSLSFICRRSRYAFFLL